LFEHQKQLRESVLPLQGKRILAVILATALLPFLETPWLQPTFNYSQIRFLHPRRGELPSITKPFLDIKQAPITSTDRAAPGNTATYSIHPNPSVLELGILLLELHYCLPIDDLRRDKNGERNINADHHAALELLSNMAHAANEDYCLAVKACLGWRYLPPGQRASFGDSGVQECFYKNVISRLEAAAGIPWAIRMEDLDNLSPEQNEAFLRHRGRDVVRRQATYSTSRDSEVVKASSSGASTETASGSTSRPTSHPDMKHSMDPKDDMIKETQSGASRAVPGQLPMNSGGYLFDASQNSDSRPK
jgi:hypothetical protein